MSGYRKTGMTRETCQGMLAYAAYHEIDPESEYLDVIWPQVPETERVRWFKAAEAVRDAARSEPVW